MNTAKSKEGKTCYTFGNKHGNLIQVFAVRVTKILQDN